MAADTFSALPQIRRSEPPLVHALYEELTETWQYVVGCAKTRHAVIIDPRLDNSAAGTDISTIAADRVLSVIKQNQYTVDQILHTHEPSQPPSSAWYLRAQILQSTGRAPRVQIGKKMAAVQRVFKRKYSMNDGSQWRTDFEDNTFSDGDEFWIGQVKARVLHLMGGDLAFVIGQHIFTGVSKFQLESRNLFSRLLGDLKDFKIYTSKDDPPAQTAKLVPILEKKENDQLGRRLGRKLVIRYAATQ